MRWPHEISLKCFVLLLDGDDYQRRRLHNRLTCFCFYLFFIAAKLNMNLYDLSDKKISRFVRGQFYYKINISAFPNSQRNPVHTLNGLCKWRVETVR